MPEYAKLKTILLFAMLLCCTSCGFSSCDRWGNAPRTEYFIQGGEVVYKAGTAATLPVQDLVRQLYVNRELHMGLWRVDADDSDERYKIEPGYVSGYSQFPGQGYRTGDQSPYQYSGMLMVDGSSLGFDLKISHPSGVEAADSDFTNLDAWGTCNYDDAQRLIKQVRLPAWSDNTSTDSVEVDWQLTGDYLGEHFSAGFTQVYVGKSRYPVYPYK